MTATMTAPAPRVLPDTRLALKRAGNPFRNYFARNPDDDVCGRFHVPELYAAERELLCAVVDLYRHDPLTHSEVVPILGNKGAGKTHLLHSIKHGAAGPWQLLVTPGTYQKDSDFLEYLLFQIVESLLGGGKQKGVRPLDYVGDLLARRQLSLALRTLGADEKVDLFPPPGIGRWARKLGIGQAQAAERCEWLAEHLGGYAAGRLPTPLVQALADAGLTPQKAYELVVAHAARTEPKNTAGHMRRNLVGGFAKAALLNDEEDLAEFLTNGFADVEFQMRPTRQDLVLALFKAVMELFRGLRVPVVVAFDQLEDLLLARRTDDGHKIAEAFFAGIVQIMHQIDGLCVLVFAERGLWNRFVPSLDGYIQDRLNNPVHVPKYGTVKSVRLEAPAADLVGRVVEARLKSVRGELPDADTPLYPFSPEQVTRVAATEPTLRDMLQQFRHLYDHLADGEEMPAASAESRIDALLGREDDVPVFKNVAVIEVPGDGERPDAMVPLTPTDVTELTYTPAVMPQPATEKPAGTAPADLWDQEFRAARRKLEPEGSVPGAAREIQAGLGCFLATCHEHGVKCGPWRLQHVVPEFTYGDHPTYGVVSLAHWACKDGQPWKVAVGLFLARGAGKPRDLEIKLSVADLKPQVADHVIVMRPEDDLAVSGKSKVAWQEAEKRGVHARLEPLTLDALAAAYGFPRWLAAVREALPEGAPLPNLADLIQEKCERLLEQVCMPVQG